MYPSVLFHRSNNGQLAIGGAMINRFEREEMVEVSEAAPQSGGWRTRFDGGAPPSGGQDLPCSLVVMYVEGLIHISGYEGAYDSEVKTAPACYAAVAIRWHGRTNEEALVRALRRFRGVPYQEERYYLQSHFSFIDRIQHDGAYDLKSAFDVVGNKGFRRSEQDRPLRLARQWHLVPKSRVPSPIRQVLHKTLVRLEETIDDNFGQGKKFFEIPNRTTTRKVKSQPA